MNAKLAAKKIYIQPDKLVYDTMLNIMSLQKGKEIFRDEPAGKLHYDIVNDDLVWTLRFHVDGLDYSRCGVTLGVEEDLKPWDDAEDEMGFLESVLSSQFALLDSMLLSQRRFCITYSDGR